MPEAFTENVDLEAIAHRIGTPFYLYSAAVMRRRIAALKAIAPGGPIQARYAMKACSTRRVLEEIRDAGLWIDAVSGNEIERAQRVGFLVDDATPAILYTADVFRDNGLDVVRRSKVLPNIGSPAMIEDLVDIGYRGPIGVRINPGFGHGHVRECDTGGPSSKHGIWHGSAETIRHAAETAELPVVLLHTHIGSGPAIAEFQTNVSRLVELFSTIVDDYPDLEAVNLGGGIPHDYQPGASELDLRPLGEILGAAQQTLSARAGRDIRLEIEPGRFIMAPAAVLVTRVHDIKATATNEKGPGHTFAMVDAGFNDLIRPAMYGAYHHISVHGDGGGETEAVVVAGPLCESGDVFTRDAAEFLEPRELPRLSRGKLLVMHDTGAYGVQMSSYYNSLGRAPQVWLDEDRFYLISRRETVEDIIAAECDEYLPL